MARAENRAGWKNGKRCKRRISVQRYVYISAREENLMRSAVRGEFGNSSKTTWSSRETHASWGGKTHPLRIL